MDMWDVCGRLGAYTIKVPPSMPFTGALYDIFMLLLRIGWEERAIFGKIRFMNYQGCERKFSVKSFVSKYPPAAANAAAAAGNRTLPFKPTKKTSKPIK